MTGQGLLVGRDRELGALAEGLRVGVPLVLVVGDAGIGKTRLVQEGLRRCRADGAVALVGACLPLQAGLPLLPLATALRAVQRADPARLTAALARLPDDAVAEIGRLVPEVAPAPRAGWPSDRHRLFAALAALLAALSGRGRVVLAVEDVHWADDLTLDFLTYLQRTWVPTSAGGALSLVVTQRGDAAPTRRSLCDWLVEARRASGRLELRLAPLTRAAVAQQVAGLLGGVPAEEFLDALYSRAEGNPFFTEQLVAAAQADDDGGSATCHLPDALPEGLRELLVDRFRRLGEAPRVVLVALAVAERPLGEPQVVDVTGRPRDVVREALRELRACALLVTDAAGHRPRHALLGEAVRGDLLPGELADVHAAVARALEATGDHALAAEAVEHWHAAGRPREELRAAAVGAQAARRLLAFGRAGDLALRAIRLTEEMPGAAEEMGLDVVELHLSAVEALQANGRDAAAAALAERAFARFGDHSERAVAAVVRERVARTRAARDRAAAGLLLEQALRLFEEVGISAAYADALQERAALRRGAGHSADGLADLHLALDVAEAVGATPAAVRAHAHLARARFVVGDVNGALDALARGRALWGPALDAGDDPEPGLWLDVFHSDGLLQLGRLDAALRIATEGRERAVRAGRGRAVQGAILLGVAADAALELGRTDDAAALVDPVSTDQPSVDTWVAHVTRARVDLHRGLAREAEHRLLVTRDVPLARDMDLDRQLMVHRARVGVWRPGRQECLDLVEQGLERLLGTEQELFCSELLVLGARAAADLAEGARARRERAAQAAALAALDRLRAVVDRAGGRPLAEHPYVARTPADRAEWNAENARATGSGSPQLWGEAADAWRQLQRPHRAAYAEWRRAEAHLARGETTAAADALRAADEGAVGHVPLRTAVAGCARRARIRLDERGPAPAVDQPAAPELGLTQRERLVLQGLGAGRTNAQIGMELFMSPKTASVHVSRILRKLGVTNRVQAAMIAQRAGLLDDAGDQRPSATRSDSPALKAVPRGPCPRAARPSPGVMAGAAQVR